MPIPTPLPRKKIKTRRWLRPGSRVIPAAKGRTGLAGGTPVLLANGTARRIEQMPRAGGAALLAPTADGRLGTATQAEMMVQGERECVSLALQDGRTLVCTPDHEILCTDGRWVRADQLVLGQDRIVVGLEAPL